MGFAGEFTGLAVKVLNIQVGTLYAVGWVGHVFPVRWSNTFKPTPLARSLTLKNKTRGLTGAMLEVMLNKPAVAPKLSAAGESVVV